MQDVLASWHLCLRLLDLPSDDVEEVGECVEGVVVLSVLQAVEVVHIATSHDQQEHPGEKLQGVGHPVKVPHRRCGSKAHRHMEPQRQAVVRVEDRGVVAV